jgi:uncharacterized protein (TIGR02147 family)
MILHHDSYRSFLKSVLAERTQRNQRYSLRRFAQNLGVSPSTLSDVLNGRKNLSPERAVEITTRLQLSPLETDYFCLLVQLEATQDERLRNVLIDRLRQTRSDEHRQQAALDLDRFAAIADWRHMAIVEMAEVANADLSPTGLASALETSPVVIKDSLERLARLGLIEWISQGGGKDPAFRPTKARWVASSTARHAALAQFHAQMLERAAAALAAQAPEERYVGTETFAFDPSQLPEVEKLANQFLDNLVALAGRAKTKAAVYHAGLQIFRLDRQRLSRKDPPLC